ncbi:hypothetical protein [uncultured Methanomethylovorans sp.]|uniref:hypothetical protein n=1 Tax=uncultured Methanomethylovorans sp. TaxID=183759 RepID=UPI002AA86637|nr:hypothetical protein [uncultured Methanomethylovorans sp.]
MSKLVISLLLIAAICLCGCIQKEEEKEKPVAYTDPGYPNTYFAHPVLGWYLNKTAYIDETQGGEVAFLFYTSDPLLSTHEGNLKLKIRTLENKPENLEVLRGLGIDILTVSADGTTIICYAPTNSLHDIGKLDFVKDVSSEKQE